VTGTPDVLTNHVRFIITFFVHINVICLYNDFLSGSIVCEKESEKPSP